MVKVSKKEEDVILTDEQTALKINNMINQNKVEDLHLRTFKTPILYKKLKYFL